VRRDGGAWLPRGLSFPRRPRKNCAKGEGLIRTKTKSRAGERVLKLPSWCIAMLRARFVQGVRLTDPVFPDRAGGFRDPSNTRRSFREARITRRDGASPEPR
jgi:hypothetical protein